MRYANEFKVGLAIIFSAVVFILGIRFFEDLPLFHSTHDMYTEFENAAGLISGNVVRINGVNVGSVNQVFINSENNLVRVNFHVDSEIPVPEGSYTKVTGFDALGVTRMDIVLGPPNNPPTPAGGFVPSDPNKDLLTEMTERAPELLGRVDSILVGLNATLATSRSLIDDPNGDLRATLTSVSSATRTLDEILRAERGHLAQTLENVEALTGNLNTFMEENSDSLGQTVQNMNAVLTRLNQNLVALENTTESMNAIMAKIENGEGTLGRMINDPDLYLRLDSTLLKVNALLLDFQTNPSKYLKDMEIIKVF